MPNENYENVNTLADEQHEQERDNRKFRPRDMLEALTNAMDISRESLTRSFKEIRSKHPQLDTGSVLRRYHLALLDALKNRGMESFNIVLGFLGLAIFDSLTEEDKEALRNDLLNE